MPNPNNCAMCDHKRYRPKDGWCYMFRREPNGVCMLRTARNREAEEIFMGLYSGIYADKGAAKC